MAPAELKDGDVVEYYHIALHTHEVILAEGAEAETLFIQDSEHEDLINFAEHDPLAGIAPMTSFAPRLCHSGGRAHVTGLLRLGASKFVDVRDPIQKAYQRLEARAVHRLAA